MPDIFFGLQKQALPALRAGDLAACDCTFLEALRQLPTSPFHVVLDLAFTNNPREVAKHFDSFFRRETKRARPWEHAI